MTTRFRGSGRGTGWTVALLVLVLGAGSSTLFTQSIANCRSFRFSPATASFSAEGGIGSVTCDKGPVSNGVYAGCTWTAISNVSWIVITGGANSNQSGFGVVRYVVQANPSAASRRGTLTFSSGDYGSAIYTVTQAGSAASQVSVSPSSLSFNFTVGGNRPAPQTLFVSSPSSDGVRFTATPFTDQGGSWLSVMPSSGTAGTGTGAALLVIVNPGNLAPGLYTGGIRIFREVLNTNTGSSLPPLATVLVRFTVTPIATVPPLITPSVLSFRFNPDQPAALPPSQVIPVASPGGIARQFGVTPQIVTPAGRNWLVLDRTSGVTPTTINVTVDPQGLGPGSYLAILTYNVSSSSELRSVSSKSGERLAANDSEMKSALILNVGPASPLIATPDQLLFEDSIPAPQQVLVTAPGGAFRLTPTATVLTGPDGWLSVTPGLPSLTPAGFNVGVSSAGFPAGSFRGVIALASTGATTGKVIQVEMQVGSNLGAPQADRDSLAFSYEAGGSQPSNQSIHLSGPAGGTATVTLASESDWLSAPQTVSLPGVLTVSARPGTLGIGSYAGSISIAANGTNFPPLQVAASLAVSNPDATGPNRPLMSQVADGDGWKTTITLVNTDSVPADFLLNFWRGDGNPLALPLEGAGTVTQSGGTIPVGGSRTITTAGGATALVQGWVELTTMQSVGGLAIFRQRAQGRPDFEAASPVAFNAGGRFLLPFDNTQGFVTSMAIVNPAPQQATVTVNVRAVDGTLLLPDSFVMAPRSQRAFALPQQYTGSAGRQGVIEFASTNSGLSGLGLRFNPGGAFTSLPIITNRDLGQAAGRRLIAQIADGDMWKTTVTLLNGEVTPGFMSLNFYRGDGTLFPVPFERIGTGSTVEGTVSASGSALLSTAGIANVLAQGWVELAGSQGVGGLAIFRQRVPGRPDFEAASPIGRNVAASFLLPFDNSQGFVTSMALVNPSNQAATVSVTIRDENGAQISTSTVCSAGARANGVLFAGPVHRCCQPPGSGGVFLAGGGFRAGAALQSRWRLYIVTGSGEVTMSAAEQFRYDVFISYRQQEPDKSWVRGELLRRLKREGFRVCIDFESFRLGAALLEEMERAVIESRYTLAVLSPEYLAGRFTKIENLMADHLGLEESRRRLLAVMRRECDPGLRTRVRLWLDMTEEAEMEERYLRLIAELRLPLDGEGPRS